MAKKPNRRSWLSKQPRWAQALYLQASGFYSPRTAREKIRELIAAPARDFKVAADGATAFLKGDRSKRPLPISERQLRIKRSGLTPEAQAAGAVRAKESYKSETNARMPVNQTIHQSVDVLLSASLVFSADSF